MLAFEVMKSISKYAMVWVLLAHIPQLLFSQDNTEVYLFDLKIEDEKIEISNPRNISNNPKAYDNQPHFLENSNDLFSIA